jgi:K+-transporting ATPase KdpF subunit
MPPTLTRRHNTSMIRRKAVDNSDLFRRLGRTRRPHPTAFDKLRKRRENSLRSGPRIRSVWMRGGSVKKTYGPAKTPRYRYLIVSCAQRVPHSRPEAANSTRMEIRSARPSLRSRHAGRFRSRRPRRLGGREAVIFFDILSAALALATLAYLVYALVKPEKF